MLGSQLFVARKNNKTICSLMVGDSEAKMEDFFDFEHKLKKLKSMRGAQLFNEQFLLLSVFQTLYLISK